MNRVGFPTAGVRRHPAPLHDGFVHRFRRCRLQVRLPFHRLVDGPVGRKARPVDPAPSPVFGPEGLQEPRSGSVHPVRCSSVPLPLLQERSPLAPGPLHARSPLDIAGTRVPAISGLLHAGSPPCLIRELLSFLKPPACGRHLPTGLALLNRRGIHLSGKKSCQAAFLVESFHDSRNSLARGFLSNPLPAKLYLTD